ncbi:endodeoxyribonuclease [Vermiconidia calcicola]|uniref:Endodeoxyribonuclease n=1 Tax=Vermiconidia calcicola TaxID=1690605 RepID=A0ACC3N0E5_9PEZI|nr:endodeoxyribonuclease [Vermiconidia calcicola]
MEYDEDFDDLLAGVELLEDSSQESLTNAAADVDLYDDDNDCTMYGEGCSPPAQATGSLTSDELMNSWNFFDRPSLSQSPLPDSFKRTGDVRSVPVPLPQDVPNTTANAAHSVSSEAADRSSMSVINKIEAIFEEIADALLQEKNELTVTLLRRTQPQNVSATSPVELTNPSQSVVSKRIRFPGRTAEEAWRFTVVVRILELMHEALRNGTVLSKRDIYYRDPALFGKQAHVDRYVDDVAFTFGVQRSKLNVTAVAKGLIAGAINICRRDGSIVEASSDREGMLVPSLRDVLSINMTAVRWILVVEKEATFRSIAASTFWDMISAQGVMLTAKGYPDIASRAFLRLLSSPSPRNGFASPPVYGLVDFDPDGLAIFSIYKHGSIRLAHENADLCVPQMQWLGLRREHMMIGGNDLHASQGLLSLTARDRRKAIKMLERCATPGDDDELQVRAALQDMLMLNTKAELQLLDAVPDGMTRLLISKLGDL